MKPVHRSDGTYLSVIHYEYLYRAGSAGVLDSWRLFDDICMAGFRLGTGNHTMAMHIMKSRPAEGTDMK